MPDEWTITEVTRYETIVYNTTRIQIEIFGYPGENI